MKTIANFFVIIFLGIFLSGATMGVSLIISETFYGFSEIPLWLRLISFILAIIFVRGINPILMYLSSWGVAGYIIGMLKVTDKLFGLGISPMGVEIAETIRMLAPGILGLGTLISIGASDFKHLSRFFPGHESRKKISTEIDNRLAFLAKLKKLGLTQSERKFFMQRYCFTNENEIFELAKNHNRSH